MYPIWRCFFLLFIGIGASLGGCNSYSSNKPTVDTAAAVTGTGIAFATKDLKGAVDGIPFAGSVADVTALFAELHLQNIDRDASATLLYSVAYLRVYPDQDKVQKIRLRSRVPEDDPRYQLIVRRYKNTQGVWGCAVELRDYGRTLLVQGGDLKHPYFIFWPDEYLDTDPTFGPAIAGMEAEIRKNGHQLP